MNEMWKAYKGQYAIDTKVISLKEYEPQEAKKRVFMCLKRLNEVLSVKRKESYLYMTCAYHMNEI